MITLSLKFHERTITDVDSILESLKKYDNRSDFIRTAVQELVDKEKREIENKAVAETVRKMMK